MMDQLQSANETALQALIVTAGKYNIAADAKDDVRLAISVLGAASGAVIAMRLDSTSPPYPPNYVESNIKVLQTTSCESFNESMKLLLKDAEHQRKLGAPTSIRNTEQGLKTVLSYAETTLTDLERDGTWAASVSSNKESASTFLASTNRCFNCGKEGCTPNKCQEPLDQDRIKANREKFNKDKRKSSKKKPLPRSYKEWDK